MNTNENSVSTISTYDLRIEWLYWEEALEELQSYTGERTDAQMADDLDHEEEIQIRMAHIDHELEGRGTMSMAEYKQMMTEEEDEELPF